MAKRHGFEIGDYGLPASIRKRIDDLIELNLNPSTINLLTSEFSNIDDDTRENVGRYIANLLEIETIMLERHFEKIKEVNVFGNSKQELILKQRKTNLLRIQQIFASKDEQLNKMRGGNNSRFEEEPSTSTIDFKNAMVTNSHNLNQEQLAKEKLKELANKKRLIELAIFEEENKIKVAQKQYQEAKNNNDSTTQELKLDLIDKSNKKLKKIDKAIKKYKTIEDLPLNILLDDDQEIDFARDEKKLREYLANKDKIAFEKMQNDLKELNNSNHLTEEDFEDFFSVEGYEDFDFHNLDQDNEEQADELDPFELLMQQEKQLKEAEIIKAKELEEQQNKIKEQKEKQEKEFNDKIIKAKQAIREKEENRIRKLAEKEKTQAIAKSKAIQEAMEVASSEKEVSERIIKKIKKNSKAKDKKIEKITKEKEIAVKELKDLKEKQKVEELRRIEISKRKAEEKTEAIIKKEKQKVDTSYNILERKWSAFRIKTTLFSKEKAINAIRLIKARAEEIERQKLEQNDDLIAYPEVEEVISESSILEEEQIIVEELVIDDSVIDEQSHEENNDTLEIEEIIEHKLEEPIIEIEEKEQIIVEEESNDYQDNLENEIVAEQKEIKNIEKVEKIQETTKENDNVKKFLEKKKNSSRESKPVGEIDYDEFKRIDYLERKKKLNIISNDELVELENKKTNQKNKQINSKVNLKKFTLIKKNNF
ncbi:hypothetical protein [Spiroplasma culicicola]|uniref:Uncharacterized protein n=1 Tax=Spiroplasma culicicola AES-1 TaxID=1276246 RepID=W6AGQ2_9MOLU|nr:hypothetical protein [Spiroplasma culicicola]AHI52864.1 hypothetical protein SCULI_v1c05230 [Spiroplasma culicicola AES-1]